jgi:hypothetical protein
MEASRTPAPLAIGTRARPTQLADGSNGSLFSRLCGHWAIGSHRTPGLGEGTLPSLNPQDLPLSPPPVALLRSLPPRLFFVLPFFPFFLFALQQDSIRTFAAPHRASDLLLSTSPPLDSTFLTATPGVIIASRHRHRFPHSGRRSPSPNISDIWRRRPLGHSSNPLAAHRALFDSRRFSRILFC